MMTKSSDSTSHNNQLRDLLGDLGLKDAINTRTEHLSAGQSRRLALAKLIAAQRPVWIMDEPLAGLDTAGCDLTSKCVAAHLDRGGIALIASHNPSHISAQSVRRLTIGVRLSDKAA